MKKVFLNIIRESIKERREKNIFIVDTTDIGVLIEFYKEVEVMDI